MEEIGSRVGAIQSSDGKVVKLFGFGTYTCNEVPPTSVGGFNLGIANPKIELDNGNTVYGCECWWGSEEKIKDMIKGLEVIEVSPEREINEEDSAKKSWC